MNITIIGSGYVGLSNAILLAQNNSVIILDIVPEKINLLNRFESPIDDDEIKDFLKKKNLNLKATTNKNEAIKDADFVIIATPTDYDSVTQYFDTKTVELVAQDVIEINSTAIIVIKSTIPVGFTKSLKKKLNFNDIIFSPEFLR